MSDPRYTICRTDIARYRDMALALADEARQRLRTLFAGDFEVRRKPDGTFVTSGDLAVETALRAIINRNCPTHGIVGEEHGAERSSADFQWILDPIDGTEEFVHRIPTFGTIIALHWRGRPVVGVLDMPMLDMRAQAAYGLGAFSGKDRLRLADLDPSTPANRIKLSLSARVNFIRGRDDSALFEAATRACPNQRIYRSCLGHLMAATGQMDAHLDVGNPIWDIAAAQILVEEAGGAFRVVRESTNGKDRIYDVAFGRPSVVARLAALPWQG
jgi:fructose-1,6-bisphosphatase/inositol monophosphatase family enzyme